MFSIFKFLRNWYLSFFDNSKIDISTMGRCDHRMSFHNPALKHKHLTAYQITLTQRNRCLQYPRCLLFGCCYDDLLVHTLEYFSNEECLNFPVFRCMFHDPPNCDYNSNIKKRLEVLDLYSSTITYELVQEGLVNLPPTPEEVYTKAESRCEFKVLFLVEGERRKDLSSGYDGLGDMVFLNYQSKVKGDFYFPTKNVNYRQMALYLIGRHLELSQTWIYNYFIFIDKDVTFKLIGMKYFTINLNTWRPAVATPSNIIYPYTDVYTEVFMDFQVKAYHRETIEILFPLILDINDYSSCPYTPALAQSLEAVLLYRNHMLALNGLFIKGFHSHNYDDKCLLYHNSFNASNYYSYLPTALSHCAILNLTKGFHVDEGIYKHKVVFNIGGEPRIKVMKYHLLNHHYKYSNQNQNLCTNTTNQEFNPDDPVCCCVDSTILHMSNGKSQSEYHNTIIKYSNKYYYVWYKYKYKLKSLDLIYQMGYKDYDVIVVDKVSFDLIKESTELNQICQNIILPDYVYTEDESLTSKN